ncbi:flagellar basal body rod protein FlgC [Halodurantibacterium flavum]|uniref:Flagellar basal body rod protein FlgC n=1 Tax=Halodurantibacterium flavum TaxID=1382802 RepID=A0ABW4S7Z6_9RHOB
MSDLIQSLAISSSGMQAQGQRLRHLSENVANADTPGYRRKTISFEPEQRFGRDTGRVEAGPVQLSQRDLTQIFAPDHPLADASGYYAGSNVDLIVEIADSREAQRSYEANLRMFDQARQMSASLLDLLKR